MDDFGSIQDYKKLHTDTHQTTPMKTFPIYYADLTPESQKELCKKFNTTPEEENWDVLALTTVEKE